MTVTVTLESNGFFLGIEYVAVFCCGLLGGLAAVRKHYDLFAIVLTTWLTALGGGLVRDVVLERFPRSASRIRAWYSPRLPQG